MCVCVCEKDTAKNKYEHIQDFGSNNRKTYIKKKKSHRSTEFLELEVKGDTTVQSPHFIDKEIEVWKFKNPVQWENLTQSESVPELRPFYSQFKLYSLHQN